MPKNKVSEWSSTAASNTDIGGIDIAEGCAPSGINNAIRELMAQVKDQQTGTDADNFTVGGNLSVTGTTTATGAVTATAGVTGNLTGNVTGNVTGTAANVTGTVAVANGGTGLTTLTANNVILGNGTSAPSFVAPSTSGNVLTSNGTTWTSAQLNRLTSDTAQASTSGTSIDFTGIPSWAKRITVMFNGVSTNGTSAVMIQIGAGTITTTGYTAGTGATASTTGFTLVNSASAANTLYGVYSFVLFGNNTWVGSTAIYTGSGTPSSGGGVTLSGALDRIRITTVNGTDTFDAGSINILYE